ncbi:hypothetical protein DPMN_099334 [Dreissena polymorpha]|uniref:Cysteine and tyrosine-rich protein 1 n=1 Tax=Dreissena polymorpha TaxID=45954 RepID=A0A9D4R6B8_DREPO|nr:hypothetical protein DPMN_099334 [Dreissena polymorpha]
MFLILAVGLNELSAVEWCFVSGSEYQYCRWGCCTVNYRTQCCTVNDNAALHKNVGFLVGKIVGGVIGLMALLSTVIVCCCIMNRKRGQHGHVLETTNSQQVFGNPGTEKAYAQQPNQPYTIQTTNTAPGYMSASTQPTPSWQPPPYEEVKKGFKP